MDLKEEEILGDAIAKHWYYVSKGRAVRALLGEHRVERMLDVGAGSGVFSKQFLEAGYCTDAVCVDPNYESESDQSYGSGRLRFLKQAPAGERADLVLMMDVLEHVDDDLSLIRAYFDDVEPGTTLLVTVPAFEFLWSGHDVFLEHRRRYTRSQVIHLLQDAGLKVTRVRYFFGLLFPIVALLRLIDRMRVATGTVEPRSSLRKAGPTLNAFLIAVHAVERVLVLPFNSLAGLSVIAVASK